jgi:adenylosuccinate synthase
MITAKYTTEINGIDNLAITKLDVLSHLKEIKVGLAYKSLGKTYYDFPTNLKVLENVKPVYKTLPGWQKTLLGTKRYQDLPTNARRYLDFIEKTLKTPIKIVSIGAERNETLFKHA